MFNLIDILLNKITMYRVALYYVVGLWAVAMLLSFFGKIPYTPMALIVSALYITAICWVTNMIFGKTFKADLNVESVYITAFILVLIISPPTVWTGTPFWELAGWASVLAMASKYILAINKKHIFNPVALAVAITAFTLGQSATWWVGTAWMLPFVFVGGALMTRKLVRSDMVITAIGVAITATVVEGVLRTNAIDPLVSLKSVVVNTALLFFVFIMFTEPLTTPPTNRLQIIYGAIVGLLFAPFIHIGSLYSTPELALLVGNIFSYLVSPKQKLILTLKERLLVAQDTYDFVFSSDLKMPFRPGQYLEWTLGHDEPDNRGNRRYFTIASSPTEDEIRMGVRCYPGASTFKNRLLAMKPGDTMTAGQLAGDFTLPQDATKKLVFIAGGIGITPFRSMIKYLIDKNEKRDLVLMYSNRTQEDIAYQDVFDAAEKRLGIRTIYALSELDRLPQNWSGQRGMITKEMIMNEIPDYKDRAFYISGPHGMVSAFERVLAEMGVPSSHIIVDFFPGFV